MQFKAAQSLKSIGTVSERSHFPLAKIKHFTMSRQILIRRKLAEEYHFPKTNRSSVSPPRVVVPSPSLSPALISSSVISSRLNANSEECWGCISFKQIICNKKPMQAGPCAPAGAGCCLKRRGWGLRFTSAPGSSPTSLPAPARTHWRKSVSGSQSQISPKQYLCFWPAVCVPGWKEKENTHRTEEQRDAEAGSSPHKTAIVGEREREKRAARRQHQHRFCSHRSAGNYDNNVFPRQPLSDLVSEHLPFLKSPPDNIWYDYKVKILFKERPLMCL